MCASIISLIFSCSSCLIYAQSIHQPGWPMYLYHVSRRSGAGILSSTFGGCAILEMTSFILSQLYTYHPLIIHKSSISFLAVFKCICAELMTVAEIYKSREILFDRNVIQFHGILCNYEVRCIKPT